MPGAAPAPVNSHEVDTDKVDISDTIDEAETKYIDISGSGSGIHRIIQYSILTMYLQTLWIRTIYGN